MKAIYDFLADRQYGEKARMSPKRIKEIRAIYGMTQRAFSSLIKVNFDTYRSWEGGYRFPSSPGLAILSVAENNPEIFLNNIDEILSEIDKRCG